MDKWERLCKCQMPMNPNDLYVNCDKCKRWFHPECVGVSREEAKRRDVFYCDACTHQPRPQANN